MCQSGCKYEQNYTGDCTIKGSFCPMEASNELDDLELDIVKLEHDLEDIFDELQDYVQETEELLALINELKELAKKKLKELERLEDQKEAIELEIGDYI